MILCRFMVNVYIVNTYIILWFQVNINPAYQADELKHTLTLTDVKCLLTLEKFKTQNYPEILEKVDPDIWKRPPNTPIESKVMPTLKSVIFDSENHIKLAFTYNNNYSTYYMVFNWNMIFVTAVPIIYKRSLTWVSIQIIVFLMFNQTKVVLFSLLQ